MLIPPFFCQEKLGFHFPFPRESFDIKRQVILSKAVWLESERKTSFELHVKFHLSIKKKSRLKGKS